MKLNETTEAAAERQLRLEEESQERGIERLEKQVRERGIAQTSIGALIIRTTGKTLTEALVARINEALAGRAGRLANVIDAYLVDTDTNPAVAVELGLRVALDHVGQNPMASFQTVCIATANAILDDISARQLRRANPSQYSYSQKQLKKRGATAKRAQKLHLTRTIGASQADKLQLGAVVIEPLAASGLFEKAAVGRKPRQRAIFRLTNEGRDWVAKHIELLARPIDYPMVSPPRDWTSLRNGGRITGRRELISGLTPAHRKALEWTDLTAVFEAVNHLQRTAWRVNGRVFDVMRSLWEQGAKLAGLPPREDWPEPARPEEPSSEEDRTRWKREAHLVRTRNAKLLSKRLGIGRRLYVAERFSEEASIYYPVRMDWRGRVYYAASHLSPQGPDMDKGLLEFAEGKRIGRAEPHLAAHLAATFGQDKVPFADRLAWVEAHEAEILDSAADPTGSQGGAMFWAQADEPWQALAACFEYADYLRDGPDHITHLPLPQDGSANVLQHLALVLKDQELAGLVNLSSGEAGPQDVYAEIARRGQIIVDQSKDDPKAARWRNGGVTRKIAKLATVQYVYNGTPHGIRETIVDHLQEAEDLYAPPSINWDDGLDAGIWSEAFALAQVLIKAIEGLSEPATDLMRSFKETGRAVAQDKRILSWITDDGLWIDHDYYKQDPATVKLHWLGKRQDMIIRVDTETLNPDRSGNAMGPNWVHSLDSAVLREAVRKLKSDGIPAPAVAHDSFATWAPYVSTLQATLAQAMQTVHAELPLLQFALDAGVEQPAAITEPSGPISVTGRYAFGAGPADSEVKIAVPEAFTEAEIDALFDKS